MSKGKDWRCGAHEELVGAVASVRAETGMILETVRRIDQRQHDAQGTLGRQEGQSGARWGMLYKLLPVLVAAAGVAIAAVAVLTR